MEDLNDEEKFKLSNIMFNDKDRPPQKQVLILLSEDERNKLKNLYCQKIAYQSVRPPLILGQRTRTPPSLGRRRRN